MTISLTEYLKSFIKLRQVIERNNPLRLSIIKFKNKKEKKKYHQAWNRYLKAKKKYEQEN